ncbi:Kap122p RNJ42_02634 [Nakaseomyces bracarensis]|uniref:Kap122p n=1 Tax=Nakaseomyces bracarensis TaxID=273131 RepID=UPI0038718CA0
MSSVHEVVALIEELYSPRPTRDVNEIQHSLQGIQKSNEGLLLSNALLIDDTFSTNVKYFGALTLAVQANVFHDHLKSQDIGFKIFRQNVAFLVKYVELAVSDPKKLAANAIVIKKLMSNLSSLFVTINNDDTTSETDFTRSWNNPINTLIQLLVAYNQMGPDQRQLCVSIDDNESVNKIFLDALNTELPYTQLIEFISTSTVCNQMILLFTEIIVEDLTKFQTKKLSMSSIHSVVHVHLYITTMALINFNLTSNNTAGNVDSLFNCVTAWVNYISLSRQVSPDGKMDLSEMFSNLINRMLQSNEQSDGYSVAEKIISIFENVFANDPLLMSYELRSTIEAIFLGVSRNGPSADLSQNQWMLQYMNYLVTNEMFAELKELAVCICDFLQINILDVCNKLFTTIQSQESMNNGYTEEYIKVLLQMTNFPLLPVLQEGFSSKMVDFWLDLSEAYANLALESLKPNAPQTSTEIFQQVINIYIPKISLANKKTFLEMNEDRSTINEFEDFRTAVADLTQSVWLVLGNENLTNILIAGVGMNEITSQDQLFQIETMGYLLEKLVKDINIPESLWILDVLEAAKYLSTNVQTLLRTGLDNDGPLSIDFVRSSTTLMSALSGFYKENPEQISPCIELLFQGLQKCTIGSNHYNKIESMLVKTISTLCSVCRKELSPFLEHFITFLQDTMKPGANYSEFSKRSLTRSIGYIIQGEFEKGPNVQGEGLTKLITLFNELVDQALVANDFPIQEKQNYIHGILECISELGSGLMYPGEIEDPAALQLLPQYHQFWSEDPLGLRNTVMHMMEKTLQNPYFQKSSVLIEVSCLILGKSLSLPNDEPFFLRFPMAEVMKFILTHLQTSDISTSLPFFIYLLEQLFSSYKDSITVEDFNFVFEKMVVSNYHTTISHDPDLLQTSVNYVNSILDTKPGIAVFSTYWTTFILPEFLKLLSHKEKFTIVAVNKFWAKVINNKKYTQEELATTRQQMASLGQELTLQVMSGLYHTQRSDLNAYTELVRALVAKFPIEMKNWLTTVLPTIVNKPEANEKLINKLFITRGSRAAGNVLLTWWLECSGLPGY